MIELRSETDNLRICKINARYIDNGTQLGWLIDRKQRRVFIYRPNIAVKVLDNQYTE